jgi:hypothetical protein
MEPAFCGRKSFPTQNVMAVVDFDLKSTFLLAGWEGITHDVVVLADALQHENYLRVPQGNIYACPITNTRKVLSNFNNHVGNIIGKFYLVDAGYGGKTGFMPPFRGVRYHLNEWGNNLVQNAEELFNLRHSSLWVTVERAFGSPKRRFKILDDAIPFFPYQIQVDIVIACAILHN